MNLAEIQKKIQEAELAMFESDKNVQTQGDSRFPKMVLFWKKQFELKKAEVNVSDTLTADQVIQTPVWLIKKRYVYCCDPTNPNGYNALTSFI